MNSKQNQKNFNRSGYKVKIIAFCMAAFAIGIGLYYALNPQISENDLQNLKQATSLYQNTKSFPIFSLTDHMENDFNNTDLIDYWSFIFFGFTHCPDVCPLALSNIDRVMNDFANSDDPQAIQGIFISVDPNRDTTERLNNYVKHFNENMIGLTGTDNEIKMLTQALGVVYTTPTNKNDNNYLVDHSAHIFLVAPDGRLSALFSAPHDSQKIIGDFKIISAYYDQQFGS